MRLYSSTILCEALWLTGVLFARNSMPKTPLNCDSDARLGREDFKHQRGEKIHSSSSVTTSIGFSVKRWM